MLQVPLSPTRVGLDVLDRVFEHFDFAIGEDDLLNIFITVIPPETTDTESIPQPIHGGTQPTVFFFSELRIFKTIPNAFRHFVQSVPIGFR